jgi:hypothetical protein
MNARTIRKSDGATIGYYSAREDRDVLKRALNGATPRTFADKPTRQVIRSWRRKVHAEWVKTTELTIEPDLYPANPDIPENQFFIDAGTQTPTGRAMSDMDRAHFTECCAVGQRGLLAFHEKRYVDTRRPRHLDPTWIAAKTGCHADDAYSLADAWRALGFDARTVNGLIFGYTTSDGVTKAGLAKANKTIPKYAKYFEDMAEEIAELENGRLSLEDYRRFYLQSYQQMADEGKLEGVPMADVMYQINKLAIQDWEEDRNDVETVGFDEQTNGAPFRDSWQVEDEEDFDQIVTHFLDPAMDFTTAEDPVIGAHPLFAGRDAVSHEMEVWIKEATPTQLTAMKRAFYPQKDPKSGRFMPARYRHLTPSEKTHAWELIRARESVIAEAAIASCPSEVLDTLCVIRRAANPRQLKRAFAYMTAHITGGEFNDMGRKLLFLKPAPEHITLIRSHYRDQQSRLAA